MSNVTQNSHDLLAITTVELTRVTGGLHSGIKEYVVQKGDNLTNIAKANGISLDRLKANNVKNRKNPDLIHPGETLLIDTGERVG